MRKKIINNSNIEAHPLEIGRLVVKTAGRDAGKIGVIIEKIDNKTVLIDGQVRRRKCNISHLESLDKKIKIKIKATIDAITKEFKTLNIEVKKTKAKPKKERPKRIRKVKEKKQVSLEKETDKAKTTKEKPKEKKKIEKPKIKKSTKEKQQTKKSVKKKPKK